MKTNKIAWSNFFKSNIICVKHISDDNWYFVLEGDVDHRNVMHAQTNYNFFSWCDL